MKKNTDEEPLTEQEISTTKGNETKINTCNNKINIFITYCVLTFCQGIMEPLGGSLYIELQKQLNVSSTVISNILTLRSISFFVAAFITSFILDKFIKTHYYISFVSILCGISLIILPFTSNIVIAFIVFFVFGYFIGTSFTAFPVYIMRLYPLKNNKMLYIAMSIYGISKTLTPLIISLCIYLNKNNDYYVSMIIFAIVLLVLSGLIFTKETPKHDKLRNIKSDIQLSNMVENNEDVVVNKLSKQVSFHLNENSRYNYGIYSLIILQIMIMFCFSGAQSIMINFITLYCNKKDQKIIINL